ncbi:DUF2247 family protein [Serratia symbiotica]|uniref:DUF2247 family protein n=1 Tax=Serratia symbiotica TaxID=138074 RepID=A0A068Z3H6_9GAMM|nr:DUF2247 family protein [Serratia symbiotica]QLH62810.1 DUF2247 family protein [Serratia symbiotica]CDS58013.1 conserved hypothetical protein [Serratia symbiotica]
MNLYPIPFDFIEKNIDLSWCDVRWGYENNLITSELPIRKAERKVLTGSYSVPELELSFVIPDSSDHIDHFLKEICSGFEKENDATVKNKWLFIVLSWLWNNRDHFEDPLNEVEIIYSDFNYPSEIEGFVKYMPPSDEYDSSVHTQMENINHLMDNWKEYLEKESAIFKI